MKSTNKAVFVVSYNTESGDSGVVGYFNKRPTEGHLTAYFKKIMPDEFIQDEEGESRYVFWDVWELTSQKLPKAVLEVDPI